MDDRSRSWAPFWLLTVSGFIAGAVLGYFSLFLEMNCHRGTYGYPGVAHAIFPLAGWLAHSETSPMPVAWAVALTQFPLYGAWIGVASRKWKHGAWIALAALLPFHAALYGVHVANA